MISKVPINIYAKEKVLTTTLCFVLFKIIRNLPSLIALIMICKCAFKSNSLLFSI